MMIRMIRKLYPQRYKMIYLIFDITLLIYVVAYMAYFDEGTFNDQIRAFSTYSVLASGMLLWLIKAFKTYNFSVWYFLFLLMGLASSLWAVDPSDIFSIMPSMVRVVFLTLFIGARISRKEDIELMMRIFVLGVVYLSVLVIIRMIDYFSSSTFYLYRLGLNIGYNPNTIAISAVYGCIILFHFILSEKHKGKIIDIVVFGFFVVVIFLTGSKKGILGLLFGLLAIGYFKSKGIKRIRNIIGAIVVVLIAWQLVMTVPALYDVVGKRIDSALNVFSVFSNADVSTQNRVGLIREAINVWFSHPFFGVGLNNFANYQDIGGITYYSHCNYVEILADLGLVGFVLYYFMPFSLYRKMSYNDSNMGILFRSIIATTLLWDFAMVSYQDFRIQMLFCLAYAFIMIESLYIKDNG